jgi:chemotaxis protein MotA
MLIVVGAVIVMGAVIGGFLMAGGHLEVLVQPSEFVVIGGAAIGSLLISTPLKVVQLLIKQILGAFASATSKADYVELLSMQYQIFKLIQQSGVMALESHFEDPGKSPILSRYKKFLSRHEAVDFLADSAKIIIVGGIAAHDLEALMDEDLRVHHDDALKPSSTLSTVSDALPGLGIVAAVLGVVITMGHIDAPPAEIGHHVGAALVGTFLGILLSYGFAAPLAASLAQRVNEEQYYCLCLKAGLLAVYKGHPPAIAVEFARRALPHDVRPTFNETEQFCRAAVAAKADEAAAA